MPASDPGHGAARLKPTARPRLTRQDPPAPPPSRRDSTPPVSRPTGSSQSSRPRNARQPPRRRQIPIDQTARTAQPNPPAVSSPEACPTPAGRVRCNRLYPAGVRQPFTNAEVQREPRNVRSWGSSGSRFRAAECLFLAKSRLSPLLEGGRNRANCDASGGACPQHQEQIQERAITPAGLPYVSPRRSERDRRGLQGECGARPS